MDSEYKVAVVCTAYNHEPYIRQCIESIINQRTTFKYMLLIHDDASTDGTSTIIREYQKKYPDIVFPIIQQENQYSKGIRIINEIILPHVKTPYIAICEGDDYWCDDSKLERQFSYMESHPDCGICVHEAKRINYIYDIQDLNTKEIYEKDYSVEEVIGFQSGHFATNSIFIRTELSRNIPNEFFCSHFGDWQMIIYGAQNKYLHYLPNVMSVYNQGVPGSYTTRTAQSLKYNIETRNEILNLLQTLDVYYDFKYEKTIKKVSRHVTRKKRELQKRYIVHKYFPFLVNVKKLLRGKKNDE